MATGYGAWPAAEGFLPDPPPPPGEAPAAAADDPASRRRRRRFSEASLALPAETRRDALSWHTEYGRRLSGSALPRAPDGEGARGAPPPPPPPARTRTRLATTHEAAHRPAAEPEPGAVICRSLSA